MLGAYHLAMPAVTLEDLAREAASCVRCALSGGRTNVVFGYGDPEADLVLVGEAPGREEDLKGEPFVGRSGQLLYRLVEEEIGLRRDEVFTCNTIKCRPPDNRDPHPDEIAACRPWLDQQLEQLRPKVLLTLGNFATRLLLDTKDGITKLRGRAYPFRSAVLVPTYHPAAVLRSGNVALAQMRADLIRAKEALAT